jgi:ketosteroid isomerase-like protein
VTQEVVAVVPNENHDPSARREELADQLAELSRRIRRLDDRGEIEDLHRTFVRALAEREFARLPEFFADDAVIDMRSHGPKKGIVAIREHFAGMPAVPLTGAGYILSSPVIDVRDDTAHGVWTWHRFIPEAAQGERTERARGVWEEGCYQCVYQKTAAGWRFARMRFRVVRPDRDAEPG